MQLVGLSGSATVMATSQHLAKKMDFWARVAKLRNANMSLVNFACLSVCPHSRMEQLVKHWTGFHEILYEGWNFNSGNYLFTTDTK